MDLSDLVHGMKPKNRNSRSERNNEEISQRRPPRHPAALTITERSRRRNLLPSITDMHGLQDYAGPSTTPTRSPDRSPSPPRQSSRVKYQEATDVRNHIICTLCDRKFDTKTRFDQHNRVFHGRTRTATKPKEATFKCPYCSKAFTSPSKRNVHQNATHMGLRPFKCEVCDKSFGYKGDLTKHMASHSGIKPHVCYICGARFSRNFYVKRHIETVHEKRKTQGKSQDKKESPSQ